MKRALSITLLSIPFLIFALPAFGFDLSLGIVGNLPYSCRVEGNCGFCDFIDLFIILQKVILSLFGGLALVMILWGGTGIITAAGNTQKVAEAKKLIISTLLGVLIILAGYFLINVLVVILVTPTKTVPDMKLFGQNWTQAFCTSSSDAKFCSERGDGTACGERGTCKNGACIPSCDYEHGSEGFSCKPIANCTNANIGGDLNKCTAANQCYTGLCPDPSTTVICCK